MVGSVGPPWVQEMSWCHISATEAQRIAMTIRDQGCTTIDRDNPPAMTQAHHDISWTTADPPTSPTADSSADTTTVASTTPTTKQPDTPTAQSASRFHRRT